MSMQVLLTSCWLEVQGKHSISCSRPPPDPSTSTGAWNLGEEEGGGREGEEGKGGRREGRERWQEGERLGRNEGRGWK